MSLLRRDPNAEETKRERKARILTAARDCLGRLPVARLTLKAIARQAGVSEGLPSMYFGSLEELAAKIAAAELRDWAELCTGRLDSGAALNRVDAVRSAAAAVVDRPLLTRCLAVAPLLIESAMDAEPASTLAAARSEAVARVARALTHACADLPAAAAEALVERLLTFAAGLEPSAHPVGGLALAADSGTDAASELARAAVAFARDRVAPPA